MTFVFKAVAHEFDDIASLIQGLLLLLPRSHPTRHTALYLLGHGRLQCYVLSGQNEDLDQSILYLTEAILLPFRASGEFGVNIVQSFIALSSALLQRSMKSKKPDDANFAIQCLRYLHGQPLDNLSIPRDEVTTSLIETLAVRAALGYSDGMQDIKDMIVLCNELFTLDISEQFALRTSSALLNAIGVCTRNDRPLLDQCIEPLREASMRWPNSPALSVVFAYSLVRRFSETLTNDDFEEATTIINRVLTSQWPEDSREFWQCMSSNIISVLAVIRSTVYDKPEYAEEAMSHNRSVLRYPSLSDDLRHSATENLKLVGDLRFRSFGGDEASAIQEALSHNPKVDGPSPSSHFEVPPSMEAVEMRIRRLQGLLSTTPPGTHYYRECLDELVESCRAKFSLTNDPTDIDDAIKYCRMSLDSTLPGGLSSTPVAISLADLLNLAFEHTHKLEDLDESIGLLSRVLTAPAGQAFYNSVVGKLISSLFRRVESLFHKQDIHVLEVIQAMDETMQRVDEVFYLAVDNKYISVPNRLRHSCTWAWLMHQASHYDISTSSISLAYEKAMSLILVARLWVVEEMPLNYASHLVHTHRLREAIETLEQGRALLWSELRGLRTSIHHISGVDRLLAEKFTQINLELERLTMSVLPSESTDANNDAANDGEGPDPFGRLMMKQRKLLEERDNIIFRVRSLPGLQNFMTASSFDSLRSAASHGPVIIINHSKFRSDILILLYDSYPSLIPTSDGFYNDANRLREDLLDARKEWGLDSMEYESALASVLEELYNLVGRPVIERLHKSNIPDQSRIWWCPTSTFCSLPLHAMGPILSNDGMKRYFSDLYISSYTPTLSALIESRKPEPGTQHPKPPSLLLVAQPDRSLPGVKGEIQVIQKLDIEVESLILRHATTAAVLEGLKHHKLVHFACHGNLEIGKPFDASFKLYGDEQLKLLDIVHSRFPAAEFAFLSACHTAELTEESIADEGLHLTAALQYCGFRSVVGTMWAMADTDGRDLARHVYRSMLSGNEEGPFYLRSAEALRDAVRRLRCTRGVTLERWVNFVHYGA